MPFRWTINPYRGCEFGCVYCYARYTHEFLELRDPMDFERRIFVKRMAAQVLSRTLARTPIGSDPIAIGTATDPYQPAERKFGLTRSMLEVFAQLGGLELSITTKSALVVRDLDLLSAINSRSKLSVNFSLMTLNRRLQRTLEPRAPRPELRLRALAELSRAGIRCNLLMMPVIPGLTDAPAAIESVVRAARRAGASAVWWRSLFLKPVGGTPLHPVHQGALSRGGGTDRRILRARGLCAARLRRTARRDLRSDAREVRFQGGPSRPARPGPCRGLRAGARHATRTRHALASAVARAGARPARWAGTTEITTPLARGCSRAISRLLECLWSGRIGIKKAAMGDKSAIEWTDATWNPVTGCTKLSPGCKNCYAERLSARLKAMGNPRYFNGFDLTLHPDQLALPLKWKQPRRVFVNSMSDLFHETIPEHFIRKCSR